ncbi:hypothetical protein HYE09_02930 [Mycoplasmopsis bovis]|nr:hypothetical protein [Mycoplasmopsis bovis]QQH26877.1 hypothetical protein HYE09_02930 [Mycoplasmopsis bovis]
MEYNSYKSIIPDNLKWRQLRFGSNSITGYELLNFVNNELLKTLKEIKIIPRYAF